MSFIAYVILIALSGIVVGALARLALPGRDPMSLLQMMLIGIGGSLAAGLLAAGLVGAACGSPGAAPSCGPVTQRPAVATTATVAAAARDADNAIQSTGYIG